MRIARKLFMLAAMALAALALTATTASAQIEVYEEEPDANHLCSDVTLTNPGHIVDGGCHVEFSGHIPLFAHAPVETPISNCDVILDAQLGGDGEGYVTNMDFQPVPAGPEAIAEVACIREPCEEDAADTVHTLEPWPVSIVEHPLEPEMEGEFVEATFCIRNSTAAEGTGQTRCQVHMPFRDLGEHDYEVGTEGAHSFCEVSPFPFPVSIRDHLLSHAGPGEQIEVIHHQP